jgi:3-hydroxyisobutyrate dehydrogenase-like beta-hydroxyacid dehydrogenase
MQSRGVEVAAYDIDPAKVSPVKYLTVDELVRGAQYVLSTVPTSSAVAVAERCVPLLRTGQFYVDLNSTSPSVKKHIAAVLAPSNAEFVEGAILGAIGVSGANTRILLGGRAARTAAEALTAMGLRASFYSECVGKASTFKMLRSIFSKGLEALLLELLVSGKRAGIEQDLWRDVVEFMGANPFDRIAENWIQTHALANERRYHEMVQVTETMREIGVEPVMTEATERFFDRSRSLQWATRVRPTTDEVIAFLNRCLHDG